MESCQTKNIKIPFYQKSGVLYTILPFYGRYDSWALMLSLLCKKANEIWENNQVAFEELQKLTKWTFHETKMIESLILKYFKQNISINQNFSFKFYFQNRNDVIEFLKEVSRYRFPDYRLLSIREVHQEHNLNEVLNKFF